MPEAIPQLFKAQGNSDAIVICLHGFTAMPYEVNPLAKACVEAGLDAVTVLFPGHGYCQTQEQRQQFGRISRDDLLNAARETVITARQHYRSVGMFGLSMGGAIALNMAAENHLDACAVAAAALRLPTKAEILIPLLSWANFCLPARSESRFFLPSYDFYHSKALRALWQVSRLARQHLHRIHCPVLALHSHNDKTIPPVVMDWMERDISAPLESSWYDESGHCMPLDVAGDKIAHQVAQFMTNRLL